LIDGGAATDLQAADLAAEMLEGARLTLPEQGRVLAAPSRLPPLELSRPLDFWSLFPRNGPDFVKAAYLELLGREPEQQRLGELAGALLSGQLAKIEILGQLRFSQDGKVVGRPVPGLWLRYSLARFYRLPVIGHGARIITALARMPRVLRGLQALEQTVHQQAAGLDRLEASAVAGVSQLRHTVEQAVETAAGARARASALEKRVSLMPDTARLASELDRRREHDIAVADSILSLADRLESLETGLSRVTAESSRRMESLAQDALRRLAEVEGAIRRQRIDLIDQQNRLSFILEDMRKRLALPVTPAEAERLVEEADHALDRLYVEFEDRFRGSRAEIKERQTAHLALMAECRAGTAERPILDVGCGRGEWLELLRERGLASCGVDLNRSMVALCHELGLDVVEADAVEHLRAVPPGSLGAVTGFHIIEHLPFKTFVQLLDVSLRALASGGVILFETPNPSNVLVGSRNFYLDPTHRNPLPSEMVVTIAEARGFVRAHARELHPSGATFGAEDHKLGEHLDRLFFGPQDYALIAWRP
jgi:SAM-dependent methyltransferase